MKKNLLLSMLPIIVACFVRAQVPTLSYLSTYYTNVFAESAAEIVVYDKDNNQLYFTNADANSVTILDFSDPSNLTKVKDIDCSTYGGGVNSVTYYNGFIAVAVEGNEKTDKGEVVFFDKDGNYVTDVVVGYLPDMITFTPDGNKVIVACEGEPSDDYVIDPKGSVTVIDVSNGIMGITQANVADIGFEQLEGNIPEGVRVFGPKTRWTDDFQNTDDSLEFYDVITSNVYPIFFETFENTNDSLKSFDVISDASNQDWIFDNYNNDHFAEVNGFGADEGAKDWLILPAFDTTGWDSVLFSFSSAMSFSGGGLSVMISNDYSNSGNPSAATWTDITNLANLSTGSYNEVFSGYIDVKSISSHETYIAFYYETASGSGGAGSVYQIDDVAIYGVNNSSYEGVTWEQGDYNNDYFVEANGYGAKGRTHTWFVIDGPSIPDYYINPFLSFSTQMNYSGGGFKVWVSDNYTGDATTTDWNEVTYNINLSSGGFSEVIDSINLEEYRNTDYALAFQYWGAPGSGNSMTWQIDDITVGTNDISVAANLEPEYIAVSDNSQYAYAFCQENNAVITVSLADNSIFGISPLGYKDHNAMGNGLDASNKDDAIKIANWPVNGMYLPDAATFKRIGGKGYLLTANEGDAREYIFDVDSESECYRLGGLDYDDGECLAFIDETRVGDLNLDETAFPNAETLQLDENLGRLKVTTTMGDTDGDGDYDELYSFGTRSFTIWDEETGDVVFDSGDDFEQWAAKYNPDGFNATNDENGFDDRSDDKGPEPEAITTGDYKDSTYAFVAFERMGGIIVYNISDPSNARAVQYSNNRDFSDTVDIEASWAGDLGPECLVYIKGEGTSDKDYVIVANEVSGSVSVYEFGDVANKAILLSTDNKWEVYPNPVSENFIKSTKVDNYSIHDLSGRLVKKVFNTQYIDIANLKPGSYMIKDSNGSSKMIIKQ